MRSMLGIPVVTQCSERKMATKIVKLVTENAFITWRMIKRTDRLSTKETFGSIGRYNSCLEIFQSGGTLFRN